jgi:chromosome segregation ATPase
MTFRDDLEAAHARIAALEAELAGRTEIVADHERAWLVEKAALVGELEGTRREIAQLTVELSRERDENARLVARIRIVQADRADRPQVIANQPTVLARDAKPVCPHCEKAGRAVALLRDSQLVPGVCPQCTTVTLLRR